MIAPLLARASAPFVLVRPAAVARKLCDFARAEEESRLEMSEAAALCEDPARRALYVRHALDETRHARMFSRRADELRREAGLGGCARPVADSARLFARLGEVGFLAFVHRGEGRGRRQFEAWQAHFARRGDDKTAALFEALITDERRHESYTRALLFELAGSPAAAQRALAVAAVRDGWRVWREAGGALAAGLYTALMLVLYCTLAPMALLLRLRARPRDAWSRPPLSPAASPSPAVPRAAHGGGGTELS